VELRTANKRGESVARLLLTKDARWPVAISAFWLVLLTGLGWYIFNPPEKRLLGFSVYSVIRLYDIPENRRRYVFDFTNGDGGEVSFFLSVSSHFTFLVSDKNKEIYTIAQDRR
jgi:hypothetical protein